MISDVRRSVSIIRVTSLCEHGVKSDVVTVAETGRHFAMDRLAGDAATSEDKGGGGRGRRGRARHRRRLPSFVFILLLAAISTTGDAAAESDGYGEFVWLPQSPV